MKDKIIKNLKLVIFIAIVAVATWVIIIQPAITFKSNEKTMEEAARRYYDLNSRELPTGERIKTIELQKLYDGGLLEKDFFIPLTKKTCSNENSWVKVRRENGVYKYYVYLECGRYKSRVDHVGPVIKLNGKETISIDKDSKYKEQGVESVIDAVDGELKTSDVVIKGKVDTSEIGTYTISYIAFDKMSNKTEVTRTVKVIRRLYKEVNEQLDGKKNFTGDPAKNYIRVSNILFRIYGVDENKNVIIVTDRDIANVNYSKLDKWLDYFYSNLNDNTKKMIVKSKFCSMTLSESDLKKTSCDKYTEERNVYIPSIVEVNNAKDKVDFMQPYTLSWVAEKKDNKQAYVTRNWAVLPEDEGIDFFAYDQDENYGVRPMMVIKGNSLIIAGNGTRENPYYMGDTKKVKGSDLLNTREVGEYIYDSNVMWRIVKIMDDGATKVISTKVEKGYGYDLTCYPTNEKGVFLYNTKDKNSVGYCLNNKITEYFDVTKFANHEIEVPIYKNKIIYGEEETVKKYKAVLSAPDMYEMFSATASNRGSYWLINSSKKPAITGAITEIGVPVNFANESFLDLAVRPVAYFKPDIVITSGKGTAEKPYLLK